MSTVTPRQRPLPDTIDEHLAAYTLATARSEAARAELEAAARERAEAVHQMWKAGMSMERIGNLVGLSKNRIQLLIATLDEEEEIPAPASSSRRRTPPPPD